MSETAVYAAGGVVWRLVEGKLRILVIHRTAYADVTLPKGKVDAGEMLAATAVREILEETGIAVCLGAPIGVSRYALPSGRTKIVHYWSTFASDEAIRASRFVPNKEIAALEWISPKKALGRLSYPVDVEILENFLALVDDGVRHTFPIVVQRHAKAAPREDWSGEDALRPLTGRGTKQAKAIVAPLQAFGVRKVYSSDAVRCVNTVTPFAAATGRRVHRVPEISQDAWEDGTSDVRAAVGARVRAGKPAVLCSHGPVLPDILRELALATGTLRGSYLDDAAALPVGAFSVVHLSATNPGSGIVAIETHEPKIADSKS
ncbi:NUDIX domain-containing protein [Microbacterium horticulturae]|uniref:NUDIX domain-containing protein n=1 Tax=Microbacterium horticulturae TaxID=3028316 RepID=A0ABY8C395_9MICO|nr:NUDIX domain-containing protein [Microbacterium sp. KACC 23027]WEG09832.1 NUDIX domain-containing protein [Microbacterium sp. KACC 23027]